MRGTALLLLFCTGCLVGDIQGGVRGPAPGDDTNGDGATLGSSSLDGTGAGDDSTSGDVLTTADATSTAPGDGTSTGEATSATEDDGGSTSGTTGTPVGGMPPTPLLYLPLDEGEGIATSDASGHQIPCSLEGPAAWTTGKTDGGVRFSDSLGTDNYVGCQDPRLEGLNQGDFSLAVWVSPLSLPRNENTNTEAFCLVCITGYHTGLSYRRNGTFRFDTWDVLQQPRKVQSTAVYPPGAWYHVAASINRTSKTMALFVDGELVDEQPLGDEAARDYGDFPWLIGLAARQAGSYGYQANAVIDEVVMYDRALTADEVAQLAGL